MGSFTSSNADRERISRIDGRVRHLNRSIFKGERQRDAVRAAMVADAKAGNTAALNKKAKRYVRHQAQIEQLEGIRDKVEDVKSRLECMSGREDLLYVMGEMSDAMRDLNALNDPGEAAQTFAQYERETIAADISEELMSDQMAGDDSTMEQAVRDIRNSVLLEVGAAVPVDMDASSEALNDRLLRLTQPGQEGH